MPHMSILGSTISYKKYLGRCLDTHSVLGKIGQELQFIHLKTVKIRAKMVENRSFSEPCRAAERACRDSGRYKCSPGSETMYFSDFEHHKVGKQL